MSLTVDLEEDPFIQKLLNQIQALAERIHVIELSMPDYVREAEARRLTGLSGTTLWRERTNPNSLIKWKDDHGVYYERASLLAHNQSRGIVRR